MADRPDGVSFGQWLKQVRRERDITQEMLAIRVGCSPWAIQKIENGLRRPSRQIAELLAQALDVPDNRRGDFMHFARTGTMSKGSVADGRVFGLKGGSRVLAVPPQSTEAPTADGTQQAQGDERKAEVLAPPNNLPVNLTRLIGREEELEDLQSRILRDDVRLITLIGPPGIGKTRLSLEVASRLAGHFPDGIYFVPLASISDPDLVIPTIARTLGLSDEGGQPVLYLLTQYLRNRKMLLVLDNFEQVLSTAPLVAQLLTNCRQLQVIVTSREALHVRGEQQFLVRTLPLPDPAHLPEPQILATYPSVELFVDRAQSITPHFALTSENARHVALICERLDGLPLAIELAAARVKLLPPAEIATRLGRSFSLLKSGARDLPARQQTLRAAIDWSYNLLAPDEQKLLARMGIFVGGCTLPAAEAICSPRGDLSMDVLEGVESLLDKSLLRQEPGVVGELRISMLEMIREYALEQLRANGEEEELGHLHAEYFLALAEVAEAEIKGPDQDEWIRRIELEHDNMRAGLRWAGEHNETELELRLAGALFGFWQPRSYLVEARNWLERALDRPGAEAHTEARAKALYGLAFMCWLQVDYAASRRYIDESLQIYEELGDRAGMAYACGCLSMLTTSTGHPEGPAWTERAIRLLRETGEKWGLAWYLNSGGLLTLAAGDNAAARAMFEESVSLFREVGDRWGVALQLCFLGHVEYREGRYDAARTNYLESLAIYRQAQDKVRTGWQYINLGVVARAEGNYEEAEDLYDLAMEYYLEIANPVYSAALLMKIALVARDSGDYVRAARYYRESLATFLEHDEKRLIPGCLEGLAGVFVARKEAAVAATILGAVDALYDMTGPPPRNIIMGPLFSAEFDEYDSYVAAAREQLGEEAFREKWAEGRTMQIGEAIEYALRNAGA